MTTFLRNFVVQNCTGHLHVALLFTAQCCNNKNFWQRYFCKNIASTLRRVYT